jgi:hypothetical protein
MESDFLSLTYLATPCDSSRVVQVEMIDDVALFIKRWVTKNGGFQISGYCGYTKPTLWV